jgi:hypothetical protein
MYTLKIDTANNELLHVVQALVQENRLWGYTFDYHTRGFTSISLSTMSVRELKRLVDLLESEEFMRDEG